MALAKDLTKRTHETLAKYDHELLRRAADFLYLTETQSSFAVESEKPGATRAKIRGSVARSLRQPTTIRRALHRATERSGRPTLSRSFISHSANWIGDDLGYRKRIAFAPPRPADARELMEGLVNLSERLRAPPTDLDPIVAAASLSFGFVYIHPFMDGNGRLHRYLIHETLSTSGFTPKGSCCRCPL